MKNKVTMSFFLALALIIVQVGVVLAAPLELEGDVTGNVTNVQVDATTDPDTVLVTLNTTAGTQTVRILATDAQTLGLVIIDSSGVATPVTPLPTAPVTVPGTKIITGPGPVVVTQPVALALAKFFGVPAADIMNAHTQGVCPTTTTQGPVTTTQGECDSHSIGFGLIAQALWMSHDLPGNYDWKLILLAKQEKDFSPLGAPDVTNWGQFKQYIKEKQTNPDKGHNLGGVMSERETPVASSTPPPAPTLSTTGITGGTSVADLELQNNSGQVNGNGNNQGNQKNNKGGNGDEHGNNEEKEKKK